MLFILKTFGAILPKTLRTDFVPYKIKSISIVNKNKPSFVEICYKNLSLNSLKMSKRALVVISEGSEEIEAVTPIDVLRRAGVEVTVAGIENSDPQICSRQVILGVEKSLKEAGGLGPYDAILLPGGLKGAFNFCNSQLLGELLKEQDKAGRLVASICAGPTALKKFGIGLGKSITSYPSFKDKMIEGNLYVYKDDRVVVDGNIITSRGPGTAIEWSLVIVEYLVGKEKADEIAKAMLVKV